MIDPIVYLLTDDESVQDETGDSKIGPTANCAVIASSQYPG